MKSQYGDRETVGTIYRNAQLENTEVSVTNGDLTNEIMKGLIEDINDTIESKPFGDIVWFLTVHEKKDLQMKRALLRRMICTKYRPYPEDDTTVFKVDSKQEIVEFCWCLTHTSEMDQVILNPDLYEKDYFDDVFCYMHFDLKRFGFAQDGVGKPYVIPGFCDRPLKGNDKIMSSPKTTSSSLSVGI